MPGAVWGEQRCRTLSFQPENGIILSKKGNKDGKLVRIKCPEHSF